MKKRGEYNIIRNNKSKTGAKPIMRKILIIGKTSYIARSLVAWLKREPGEYDVDAADIDDLKRGNYILESYDAVFHVAGIVNETKELDSLFKYVNRDLAIEIASKSKSGGAKRFIFMSSMDVYGAGSLYSRTQIINANSKVMKTDPNNRVKIEAEDNIMALNDDSFSVCVIRAPMVYGAACDGNYRQLRRFVLKFGLIPDYANCRSAIYIGNLCEYIRLLIESDISGVFCPMDAEPFNTPEVMERVAIENGRKYAKSKLFGACLKLASVFFIYLRDLFGNLSYDAALSGIPPEEYNILGLMDAVRETEMGFRLIKNIHGRRKL